MPQLLAFSQRAPSILRQASTPTGSVPQANAPARPSVTTAAIDGPNVHAAQEHLVPSTTRGAGRQKTRSLAACLSASGEKAAGSWQVST